MTVVGLEPAFLADLDGSVFVNRDRVTRIDRLEEVVAQKIDRDDAAAVPDVIDDQSPGRDAVDVVREQEGLE
jgi:hypothetical protein